MKRKTVNLKERKEVYMGVFGGKKMKGGMLQLCYSIRNKKNRKFLKREKICVFLECPVGIYGCTLHEWPCRQWYLLLTNVKLKS